MRRRYEIRYDAAVRRYTIEVVDKRRQSRYIESCADWESAESLPVTVMGGLRSLKVVSNGSGPSRKSSAFFVNGARRCLSWWSFQCLRRSAGSMLGWHRGNL